MKVPQAVNRRFIFGFLAAFFWAISIVISRYVFNQGENPYTMAFWTALLASPVWLYHLTKHKTEVKDLNSKVIASLIIIGVVGSIGISLMEVLALKNTTAINFSFLIRSVVVFTAIFALVAFKEPLTKKKIILITLIMLGSFLLVTRGKSIALRPGDMFTLIEAAAIAFVNNILIKFTVSKIHPDFSAAITFFIGLIPIIIFTIANNAVRLPINWFVILTVVACDILLVQTRNRAYKIATASYVTMMMSFTPVLATLFAFITLRESMTIVQLLGGGFIVLAGISAEKLNI